MSNFIWSDRKRLLFFGLPWSFTKYNLSKEKFIVETGLFTIRQEEVRLYRILDISLTRTLLQRIFGLGTIICKTSDKTSPILEIKNIKNSLEIKEQISNMVEEERIKKRVSSREFMETNEHFECDCDDIN